MILTSPGLKRSRIATAVEWIWDINQPVQWNVTFVCFFSSVAASTTGCSPPMQISRLLCLQNFQSGLGATLSGDQERTRWHCDAQVECVDCVDPMFGLGWPGPFEKFENAHWFGIRCLSLIRLKPNIFSSGLAVGQLEERKSVLHVEGLFKSLYIQLLGTKLSWHVKFKIPVAMCRFARCPGALAW